MPIISIRVSDEMMSELKEKFPAHGEISRLVRDHLRAALNGVNVDKHGNIDNILNVPVVSMTSGMFRNLMGNVRDMDKFVDDLVKESYELVHRLTVPPTKKFEFFLQMLSACNVIRGKFVDTPEKLSYKLERTVLTEELTHNFLIRILESFAERINVQLSVQWEGEPAFDLPELIISKERSE